MKTLVLTACIGKISWAKYTLPTIKDYAKKINSDFICIDKLRPGIVHPTWEKYQMYKLFNTYNRIIWIDLDVLVKPETPNLFDIVPDNKFGIFNSEPYIPEYYEEVDDPLFQIIKRTAKQRKQYFNAGVLVVSRCHKLLYKEPGNFLGHNLSLMDQQQINDQIWGMKIPWYDITWKFNCTPMVQRSHNRYDAYILHYAGINREVLKLCMYKDKKLFFQGGEINAHCNYPNHGFSLPEDYAPAGN